MDNNERLESLLESLIKVIGRVAIPVDKVAEIVNTSPKLVRAFNLCDGTATQLDIAKKCGVDPGNFNRAISRWIESGVAFWIGSGKNARLLHIYPISIPTKKKEMRK